MLLLVSLGCSAVFGFELPHARKQQAVESLAGLLELLNEEASQPVVVEDCNCQVTKEECDASFPQYPDDLETCFINHGSEIGQLCNQHCQNELTWTECQSNYGSEINQYCQGTLDFATCLSNHGSAIDQHCEDNLEFSTCQANHENHCASWSNEAECKQFCGTECPLGPYSSSRSNIHDPATARILTWDTLFEIIWHCNEAYENFRPRPTYTPAPGGWLTEEPHIDSTMFNYIYTCLEKAKTYCMEDLDNCDPEGIINWDFIYSS